MPQKHAVSFFGWNRWCSNLVCHATKCLLDLNGSAFEFSIIQMWHKYFFFFRQKDNFNKKTSLFSFSVFCSIEQSFYLKLTSTLTRTWINLPTFCSIRCRACIHPRFLPSERASCRKHARRRNKIQNKSHIFSFTLLLFIGSCEQTMIEICFSWELVDFHVIRCLAMASFWKQNHQSTCHMTVMLFTTKTIWQR